MFRLLGFLVGSLVSMGLLVYLIGMPRFGTDADQELVARFDAAVEKLKDKRDDSGPSDAPAPNEGDNGEPKAAPGESATDALAAGTALPNQNGVEVRDMKEPTPEADTDAIALIGSEPEWHEFWTPFSSDIAARGFVNRLESITGLDYRVTRVATGRYQVEFAYRDPAELDANLSQIAAATGLDVSGEYP